MIIRNVVKRIVNRFQGAIPAEAEMKYLLSQGFKVGKNFRNHSDYAIDGLFPWLITIGDNVIISAGSVVTKDIPTGTVYAGNPAQYICTIEEYKSKHISQLENVPVYDGPIAKWQTLSIGEKEPMRLSLKDTFGYMK